MITKARRALSSGCSSVSERVRQFQQAADRRPSQAKLTETRSSGTALWIFVKCNLFLPQTCQNPNSFMGEAEASIICPCPVPGPAAHRHLETSPWAAPPKVPSCRLLPVDWLCADFEMQLQCSAGGEPPRPLSPVPWSHPTSPRHSALLSTLHTLWLIRV